jgi:hypothetical protein
LKHSFKRKRRPSFTLQFMIKLRTTEKAIHWKALPLNDPQNMWKHKRLLTRKYYSCGRLYSQDASSITAFRNEMQNWSQNGNKT